jgi:hypothetical protein
MLQPSYKVSWPTVLALMAAALVVVAPFTVRGVACGHDLTFHMNSWMEVAQQWRAGVLYPRWAPNANYGGGEPRFLFYPPLSWMLGGALGSFIPWLFVPVVFDCCAVFLAGLAMHRMAREWFSEPDATLIAVAYAVNPYLLLTIYARSAFAELLAASFFPLVTLWIVRDRPARQMFVPLALTMAGVWLTNVPAAIIASYAAIILLVIATVSRRNSGVFLYGAAAIAMGLLLSSFYIVPVLQEKTWITLAQFLSPGVRPAENFLFTRIGEPQHDSFLRALSWLALAELGATALGAVAAMRWRLRNPKLWWSLVVLAGIALMMMLPMMRLAYRFMPDLQFLQFPWRWLLVVSLAYAVFVVAATPESRSGSHSRAALFVRGSSGRAALCALLFVGVIALCNRALQPFCAPQDTPFMISNLFHTGYGYMGTDEYVPAGGDNYEIKPDFPEYRLRSAAGGVPPSDARVTQFRSSIYRKRFAVDSPHPVVIVLRLMNYPAWRVTVNRATVAPQSDDPTGRMVIALPAGRSEVDVRFVRTIDRWIGDAMSLIAIIGLCGFWYREKRMAFGSWLLALGF